MFTINLFPAEEGFIKNWKEKRATEKGRRYRKADQTFPSIDAALTYLKTLYVGDAWPLLC